MRIFYIIKNALSSATVKPARTVGGGVDSGRFV
jgi:hypothetical protein